MNKVLNSFQLRKYFQTHEERVIWHKNLKETKIYWNLELTEG